MDETQRLVVVLRDHNQSLRRYQLLRILIEVRHDLREYALLEVTLFLLALGLVGLLSTDSDC